MASKLVNFGGPNPHTSGLFADMTVDGPEIGTLVLIVDRGKNLPNRKTMGKQNPYCAARLGKEAKKTETDKRGGQTPRWDQELRFTVHDSPDYHTLKISIFSEDKRTDLIGEAWVSLTDILNPGGGKADLWQSLNYKGKYAGELRIELTYYDTRPRPESTAEAVPAIDDLRQSVGAGSGRVKRRPLPSNPNSGHVTPDTISQLGAPGRAKHGPREIRAPLRANSMPPEQIAYPQSQTIYAAPTPVHGQTYASSSGAPMHQTQPNQHHAEYNGYQEPTSYQPSGDPLYQPDFLPQLPPSNRQRGSLPLQPRLSNGPVQPAPYFLPQSHIGLPHSHSSPAVPLSSHEASEFDDGHQLRLDYPEPIPDLDYQHQRVGTQRRRSDIGSGWDTNYQDPYANRQMQVQETHDAPPPPPVHSNSAPVVPHYSHSPSNSLVLSTPPSAHRGTPYSGRHYSVPNSSPLQSIELTYGTQPQRPSMHGYTSSPEQNSYEGSPSNHLPDQTPSPYARHPPASRPMQNRHSVADPYNTTPSRPHPLSQEVPRPRSPQPYYAQELPGSSPHPTGHSPYEHDYRGRDAAVPLIKPRAISPQPARPPPQSDSAPRPKSSYSLQYPIRSFESSDNSPLNTSRPSPGINTQVPRALPNRKSISPHPSSAGGGMPFSPDSFDVHNPNSRQSTLPVGNSPHTPYQVKPGSSTMPHGSTGPIVGWHGQEIDPSDHLPVDSWAPEPEKKTPTKMYGLGRDRDFGPRSAQSSESRHLSKDTVVNVRPRAQTLPPQEEQSPSRNKLQKKSPGRSPIEPLKERHNYNSVSVPDPYAQNEYSPAFYQSNETGGYGGYAPPSTSPTDVLTREISSIDIGSGRFSRGGGGVPAPASYVPVRSHKDRRTFY